MITMIVSKEIGDQVGAPDGSWWGKVVTIKGVEYSLIAAEPHGERFKLTLNGAPLRVVPAGVKPQVVVVDYEVPQP